MRRIHYLTCALLALSWTAPLVAQQPTGTIRGRITDNSTQQPIAGATVTVAGRSALSQRTATGHSDRGACNRLLCAVVGDASANGSGGLLGDEWCGPGQCQERARQIMDTAHTTSQAVTVTT